MEIIEIKEFNERVYKSVLDLLSQLDPEIKPPSKDFFKSILESENTYFFVAELENRDIVGILSLTTYSIPTGTKFWIEDVVVDVSQRGKGYGKELMLHAMRFAGSLGARTIDLTSRPYRTAANRLYLDLGFKRRKTNVYRYHIPSEFRKV